MFRVAIDSCEPALKEDGSQDGYGEGARWTPAYKVQGRVLDPDEFARVKEGDYGFFKGNFKNPPQPGTTEQFAAKAKKDGGGKISFKDGFFDDGKPIWWLVIERAKDTSYGGGQPQRGPSSQPARQNAPAGASGASGGTSSAPARQVPTVSERGMALLDLWPRGVKVAKLAAERAGLTNISDEVFLDAGFKVTMHWQIALDHGDIKADPSAEELAAAEEARQAEVERAAEIVRQEDERKRKAAESKTEGYVQKAAPTDEIPFALFLALGTAFTIGARLLLA